MKNDQDKMNDYQSLIEEYKKREKLLENRIEELCDSPFIKQAEERGNIYKKYTENENTDNKNTNEKNTKSGNKINQNLKKTIIFKIFLILRIQKKMIIYFQCQEYQIKIL